MTNVELRNHIDTALATVVANQESFKSEVERIHDIDQKQFKSIEEIKEHIHGLREEKIKQNGRLGKVEVRVENLEKVDTEIKANIKENGLRAFWEKNWKAILFIAMALLGFKAEILCIITGL